MIQRDAFEEVGPSAGPRPMKLIDRLAREYIAANDEWMAEVT